MAGPEAATAAGDGPARRPAGIAVGYVLGLVAAVLFGASAPVVKRIGQDVDPQLLAGILSAGAAAAVMPPALWRRRSATDSPFGRPDVAALSGVVLLGGVLGPVLLMSGLQRVSGLSAALLLNLEGPLTVVVGVAVFHEHLSSRAKVSAALIFGGAAVLGAAGRSGSAAGSVGVAGVVLIAMACLAWALDNNLTQVLTVRDPFAVVAVKTSAAAMVNLGVATTRQAPWPAAVTTIGLLLVGVVAYGLSVVAAAYSLRLLGAAREAAVFASAPLAGVAVAAALGDRVGPGSAVALALMVAGLVAMIGERHIHRHRHERLAHAHRHRHDEHHRHRHGAGDPDGEPHAHRHRHDALVHSGEHVSDAHHRHDHGESAGGG